MKAFGRMYEELDRTTSTNAKVAAMAAYFRVAPPGDAAWALFFLTQRKVKRLLPTRVLWELTMEMTGLPGWLLEHCYAAVGDGAELVALLVDRPADSPARAKKTTSLERWMQERAAPRTWTRCAGEAMRAYWTALDTQIFVLNKIITGELRVGVPRRWRSAPWPRSRMSPIGDGPPRHGRLAALGGVLLRCHARPRAG